MTSLLALGRRFATNTSRLWRHLRPSPSRCASTTSKEGYQSIGSFHSENPEELIRLPDSEYMAPELPFSTESEESPKHFQPSSTPFVDANYFQKAYPHLDRSRWTFLNHGAFGLALSNGLKRATAWQKFLETQPLRYFDRYLLNHLVHSARVMVDFCSSTQEEENKLRLRESVAMIPNVTSGMNAVIGGHARCYKKKVFYYDVGYGSTKKMCGAYHGNDAVVIQFEDEFLPALQQIDCVSCRDDNDWNHAVADVFRRALDTAVRKEISSDGSLSTNVLNGSILILDHITSNTAIHMPISAIAKYAKEQYGMIVVVDGAHGLLGLDLDMCKILDSGDKDDSCFSGYVDIYLTNAHKWFSSPRGAALMFCANPSLRETMLRRPAVVSHGVDDGYLSRFLWDGCRDYASQLSLPAIADYWSLIGAKTVRTAMERNLSQGVKILISKWHPGVCDGTKDGADFFSVSQQSSVKGLTLVPFGIHAPMMALVQLPLDISGYNRSDDTKKTSTDAKRIQDFLYSQQIEVPVKCIRGVLYVRISCHLYNTEQEFENLARALLRYR